VTRLRNDKVVLIFEGEKAGGSQATWDKTIYQLRSYFASVVKDGMGKVFGVAAIGRQVVFLEPEGSDKDNGRCAQAVQRA